MSNQTLSLEDGDGSIAEEIEEVYDEELARKISNIMKNDADLDLPWPESREMLEWYHGI